MSELLHRLPIVRDLKNLMIKNDKFDDSDFRKLGDPRKIGQSTIWHAVLSYAVGTFLGGCIRIGLVMKGEYANEAGY